MSISDHFNKFYETIKLTPDQREDAKTKYNGICKKLHNHYYENVEYDGRTKLLIGSYGKQTNIRPPRDVDVIFIMPPAKFDDYSDNKTNPQTQLLQDIRKILSEKYSTSEKPKAWGKVVLVTFTDGTHNVEVLPAWENEDGTFLIPNSENGGSWENWDPRSEINNIQEFDNDNGITKKLIRMIKKWSENCSVDIKTYEIEVAIMDFFFQKLHEGKPYPCVIRDFFKFFYENEKEETIQTHLNTAWNRAIKACDFEKDGDLDSAIDEWRKVFGEDFPKNIKKNAASEFEAILAKMQRDYPAEKEEFLKSTYGIDTVLDPRYRIKIDATVNMDGFRPKLLSLFNIGLLLLPKKRTLTFKIINKTVPVSYQVMWKVRNFGDEAQLEHDLRGEISRDKGEEEKIEHTKYRGVHYVECYIIQNNVCIAFDRVKVPIGVDSE